MKNEILEAAITEAQLGEEANLQKAEDMLMDYLINHPNDTEAWLLLTRIECNIPFADPNRIKHYAEHVLAYDPGNLYALLFLSYTDYFQYGCSDENLYSKIMNANTTNPEMLAMLEVAKARYYKDRDLERCIRALKKSIEYSQSQRINLCMLGKIYIQQRLDYKQILEGAELIKRGLSNVILIADEETPYDPTSISDFFAEFFSGTIIGIVEYEILKKIITVDETDER